MAYREESQIQSWGETERESVRKKRNDEAIVKDAESEQLNGQRIKGIRWGLCQLACAPLTQLKKSCLVPN